MRLKEYMSAIRKRIKRIPILGRLAAEVYWIVTGGRTRPGPFPGSRKYWEEHYASGGDSGVGSRGKFAQFKAEIVNGFVAAQRVKSVIDFGCGDGSQLLLANYESYLGLDVSETAIRLCKERFAADTTKAFKLMHEYAGERADLALSLDVIFHLVEDEVFEGYINTLFNAAGRFVIVYSSNTEKNPWYTGAHIKHRRFTSWVEENLAGWELREHIPNRYPYRGDHTKGSFADFYIYERV